MLYSYLGGGGGGSSRLNYSQAASFTGQRSKVILNPSEVPLEPLAALKRSLNESRLLKLYSQSLSVSGLTSKLKEDKNAS